MQEKEMYTLKELYDNLEIPYAKLGKLADMSEGTVTRIRDGYPARRTTLNRLLGAFSKVYSRQLSLENVTGVLIEDKHKPEKAIETPIPSPVIKHTQPVPERPKRPYNRKQDTGLPAGTILATDFANSHSVNRRTFYDHINTGLGKGGLIHGPGVPEDGSVFVKDYVRAESRPKPGRPHETEFYLTPDQQAAALKFWQKWKVPFTQCDQPGCPCKGESN